MDIPTTKNHFRPYMSESLPVSGTAMVSAIIYDVNTQVYWLNPPRSVMILGMAVAVIVMNREPRNIDSMAPAKAVITCRLGREL